MNLGCFRSEVRVEIKFFLWMFEGVYIQRDVLKRGKGEELEDKGSKFLKKRGQLRFISAQIFINLRGGGGATCYGM